MGSFLLAMVDLSCRFTSRIEFKSSKRGTSNGSQRSSSTHKEDRSEWRPAPLRETARADETKTPAFQKNKKEQYLALFFSLERVHARQNDSKVGRFLRGSSTRSPPRGCEIIITVHRTPMRPAEPTRRPLGRSRSRRSACRGLPRAASDAEP